ncbi:hypothetical protein CBW65_22490 [Tumebacillus avium]|uniref:Uncharacterized protein n=1 Tax=Tumebacillus avium TaxID=1903704 RepID=A0A1Y0IUI6_9BACL|nr:hypothetical protein [Tumebacillus avium]ARU63456.1 hypothetical protein CBW65_22490 [Tumebacillus avium]
MILTVDGLEVLESGSLHALHEESLLFEFDDGDGALTVRLTFKDKRNCERDVEFEELNEWEVLLTFVNFDDPDGVSNKKKLLEVGEFRGRSLYLRYFVIGSKDSENMLVHYTWFLGPKE